jgi:septum formation topological specificity factor MinE
LVDAADNAKGLWAKEAKLQRLQEEFVEAVNKFVFWTKSEVLLDLEQDGSGELLVYMTEKAKKKAIDLFKPLIPPSSIVDTGHHWMCPAIYNPMLVDLD